MGAIPDLDAAERAAIPLVALALGVGGVIPFAALSAALWFVDGDAASVAQTAIKIYGAVILSFMAGVHWGLALARSSGGAPDGMTQKMYVASVLPALAGWGAALMAFFWSAVALIVAFLALLAFDLWLVRRRFAPGWYARLRILLTTAVVVSLSAAALSAA